MAEEVSTVSSAARMLEACVDAFSLVGTGRDWSKDYQLAALKISLLGLRLQRWKRARDSALPRLPAETERTQTVLSSILRCLQDAQAMSMRHGSDDALQKDRASRNNIADFTGKVQAMTGARRAGRSSRIRWAVYDKQNLDRLVDNLTRYMSILETETTFKFQEQLAQLADSQASHLVRPLEMEDPEDTVHCVDDAAAEVDPIFNHALSARNHSFKDVKDGQRESASFADWVNISQAPTGYSHSYSNILATGQSRVHNGNVFGSKTVLDDW